MQAMLPNDCGGYCDLVEANCAGDNTVYANRDDCLATCAAFPADAEVGAVDGNSLQCRIYHADVAGQDGQDPAFHCPHASMHGGGVCGTRAMAYCNQALANCTGDNVIYANRDDCMAAAAAMPEGTDSDTAGNTVQCRTYHASFPAAGDAATHCPHASIASDANICGSNCMAYCDQYLANCPNREYENRDVCMAACANLAVGSWNDTAADSVQCRAYHASFPAAGDADFHCPHAGTNGGGVCVNPE
jgi:hypothetical protein